MYKTSDTPNSGSIPNDAFIEFQTAGGFQQHFLGTLLNQGIIDTAIAKTRFTVISKSANFDIQFSDGNKAYYRVTGTTEITIQNLADGGYTVGDEVTLVNRDVSTKTFDTTGVTVNVGTSWQLGFNEVGSAITLICVGASEWDAVGDLEVA